MTYAAHPYASATPSPSSSPSSRIKTKTRPQRPTIITSSSSFLDATPTTAASSSRSPSPITFARASVINASPYSSAAANGNLREKNKLSLGRSEKKDRRRGLMATESQRVAHAGLDALLRVPESACPRSVPQPRMPNVQLVRSATNLSVTPSIVHQPSPRSSSRIGERKIGGNGNESDGSSNSTCTPRGTSPTPSSGSGSGSAPSTPGQPRTPVSIEFKFENNQEGSFTYPAVAPLSICKANRTPSPSPPSKLRSITSTDIPSSPTPSGTSKESFNNSSENDFGLRKKRSRGRFGARTAATPRADHLFSPLEVDTSIAQSHDVELPTLTGVLEEFEREALKIPPVPSLPNNNTNETKARVEEEKADDDDEWIDIPSNEDGLLEDAEYYRADIASHLQLFSSSSSLPPLSRVPSDTRSGHRRGGSNSSFSSLSRWQLPPARPDSMLPPPHSLSSFPEVAPSLPPLPPLPDLPNEIEHHGFLRRASASSLASTASNRSSRSNRSTGSASDRRKRRSGRRSVAKRSAAVATGSGRRRGSSGTLRVNRPLPPIPDNGVSRKGPDSVLDPTFCEFLQEEEKQQESERNQFRPRPPRSRPPPRFSIPVSVDEEEFAEEMSPMETRAGLGLGVARNTMASVVEEDEDEDGLIDPFVLERYSVASASHSQVLPRNDEDREGVDPFTIPPQSGKSEETNGSVDVPLSAPTSSPFSSIEYVQQQPQPFLLVPESPAPSSTFSGSGSSNSGEASLTFDAESLYSSYAGFSPAPSSTFPSSCNSDDTNSSFVCDRKESAQSVYLDASGRPLQSRWSVSTFASMAPPSSTRSFFPIPKLVSTVPSRLSARLRASREKTMQQSREREEKERREGKEQQQQIVRPFPFFPTPTPPSPKRKTNPGPGKYVPKPELMPAKERTKLSESGKGTTTKSPRSSVETVKTASTSSASMSSSSSSASSIVSTRSSTRSSSTHANTPTVTANQHPRGPPSPIKAQFAQYHAHRQATRAHVRSISPTSTMTNTSAVSSTFSSCSSPPRSMKSSLKSKPSTDSLSAFPFVIGGESLTPLNNPVNNLSSSSSGVAGTMSCSVDAVRTSGQRPRGAESGGGLRRKGIPSELFA